MEDYFNLFASPHQESRMKLNKNCSAWSGHRFQQVPGTSQASCPICGDTIELTNESTPVQCYNFYGHKFSLYREAKQVKGTYCFICGLTKPV